MGIIKRIYHFLERMMAARKMAGKKNVKVIGLTGSQGKTSVSVAIVSVLKEKYRVIQTDLNLDPIYAIPRMIRDLKDEEVAVVEMAVDKPGQMKQYLGLVQPQFGVLTGIAPVHADENHLGSIEGIMREKSELLKALPDSGVVFCNWDDERVRQMSTSTKARIIKYGYSEGVDVRIVSALPTLGGTRIELVCGEKSSTFKLQLIGKHHAFTAAAAFAVGKELGLEETQILKGLVEISPLPGRMSLESGPGGSLILNDSRRANLASTLVGLETLKEIDAKRKIAIIGPMAEMGDYEESGHREVGKKLAETKPDYAICVGGATKYIYEEAVGVLGTEKLYFAQDVFQAAARLKQIMRKGDLWYLKGSLLKHLERIPLIIEGKKVDPDEIASHRYEIYQ